MDFNPLKDLVEGIAAACDALANIADLFKKLVGGFEAAGTRRLRRRLLDTTVDFSWLIDYQSDLAASLRSYVVDAPALDPIARAERWEAVVERLCRVMTQLTIEISSLRSERSDFVLESTHGRLLHLFEIPSRLLMAIRTYGDRSGAPSTEAELKLLADAAGCYARLLVEADRARNEMNAYIKSLKAPKE